MKKIGILLGLLFLLNHGIVLSTDEATEDSESKIENQVEDSDVKFESKAATVKKPVAKKAEVKKDIPTNNDDNCKKIKNWFRSERKLFINGQDSPISIVVTDKDNKQHYYTIPAGTSKPVEHVPLHIKKIVCEGNYQYKDIAISGTALNTYSVFIFTIDNKLEQLHFIDIKQKTNALDRVKNALREARLSLNRDKQLIEKLMKKVEDIEEQTIYLQ